MTPICLGDAFASAAITTRERDAHDLGYVSPGEHGEAGIDIL